MASTMKYQEVSNEMKHGQAGKEEGRRLLFEMNNGMVLKILPTKAWPYLVSESYLSHPFKHALYRRVHRDAQ